MTCWSSWCALQRPRADDEKKWQDREPLEKEDEAQQDEDEKKEEPDKGLGWRVCGGIRAVSACGGLTTPPLSPLPLPPCLPAWLSASAAQEERPGHEGRGAQGDE